MDPKVESFEELFEMKKTTSKKVTVTKKDVRRKRVKLSKKEIAEPTTMSLTGLRRRGKWWLRRTSVRK